MNLSQIMTQIRGLSYSKKDSNNNSFKGAIPVLRAGNIQDSKIIEEDYVYVPNDLVKNKQYLKHGDVLIAASSGSISIVGKAAMIEYDMNATFGAFCKVLRPNSEKINIRYFKHFFETDYYKRTIKSLAEGANINNLKTEHFDDLEIPLPPLDQQKKIAAILDAADAYRQKTKALIEKYDELTQSLFLDMFGDPVSNPKGWEKIPLKEFGKVITGNTPSRKNEFNYNEKHIEWIKTNNIDNKSLFVTQAEEYLSKEGLTNGRSVKEGSLLIACIAGSLESIGRASLTNRKVAFNQQINAIEPSQGVNSRFLYYLFRMCPKYIQNHASKGMKRMLSKGAFQEIKMILPGFEIQTQFAERVQAIEEQKAQAQASLSQAEDLFNSLLQRAFKGELV